VVKRGFGAPANRRLVEGAGKKSPERPCLAVAKGTAVRDALILLIHLATEKDRGVAKKLSSKSVLNWEQKGRKRSNFSNCSYRFRKWPGTRRKEEGKVEGERNGNSVGGGGRREERIVRSFGGIQER